MSGYVRRNKKVYSYCEPQEFYDFYNRASLGSTMVKLDGEYYYLTDNGFRRIKSNDVVVFDKNKDYWIKEDNFIISKDRFNNDYELVKNIPDINGFIVEFSLYMKPDSMIRVFKIMLKECENDYLNNQLQWIIDNQDVFSYMLS